MEKIGFAVALAFAGRLLSQDAVTPMRQGLELMNQGRYREAEAPLRDALKIAGPANPTAVYNLAALYHRQARFPEAAQLYRVALDRIERTRGPFDPAVVECLNDLGALYRSLGRYSQAIAMLERATDILGRNWSRELAATVLNNLADAYFDAGEYTKAESSLRRALAVAESRPDQEPSQRAYLLSSLGRGYMLRKQYLRAEEVYSTALSVFAATLGSGHPQYAMALTNLAFVYQRQRRFREALPLLELAIEILERTVGRGAPVLGTALDGYAEVMKALGRKSEARQIARRAKSIARPHAGAVDVTVLQQRGRRME